MREPRSGHRTLRLSLPVSLYLLLESIAEEDEETVHAIVYRAVGNYVHNRTLS